MSSIKQEVIVKEEQVIVKEEEEFCHVEPSSGQSKIGVSDIQSDGSESDLGHCESMYKDEHYSDNVKLSEVSEVTDINIDGNGGYSSESLLKVYRIDEVVFNSQGEVMIKETNELVRNEQEECFGFYNSNTIPALKINANTEGETTFDCDFCSISTSSMQYLKRHTLVHTKFKRPIVQCQFCSFKSTLKIVQIHVLEKHYVSSQHCPYCSFTTKYRNTLTTHLLLHTKHKHQLFRCSYCSYESPKGTLRMHISQCHKTSRQVMNKPPTQVLISMTSCITCRFNKKSKPIKNQDSVGSKNLVVDIVKSDGREVVTNKVKKNKKDAVVLGNNKVSKICAKNKRKPQKTQEKYHDKDATNVLTCPHCYFRSPHKNIWSRHFNRCNPQNDRTTEIILKDPPKSQEEPWGDYECEICNFKTSYANSLTIHKIILHPRLPSADEKSDSLSNSGLIRDAQGHKRGNREQKGIKKRGLKSFPCDMCPFVSKSNSGFASHKLFHLRRQNKTST
ncbi:zinc finger protein 90-like [Cylas formicarius]|uniref:zinc finger protein 90-like n=1 Tax=Cylas formicarius TaxID=197179 RepID=UPI00295867C4|nr:zinc finger protein 90-like [Cylas formicarius]